MPDPELIQRWKLIIEYDGRPFSGWQYQDHKPSVQGAIEDAISRWYGPPVRLSVAGRTDAGVHAMGQVAHVDLAAHVSAKNIRDATNAHLGNLPVAIITADPVDPDFDARFSARMRHYQYRIMNRHAPLILERGRAWHIRKILDVDAMQQAGQYLIGHHDFSSFRSSQCQGKSPHRSIDRLHFTTQPCLDGRLIMMDIAARSFLHHQVRNIIGTLVQIGLGRWQTEYICSILEARDRKMAGQTAPPDGLYFMAVDYQHA